MGYRRLLLTRWTRRDALAVLVVIVTVAFLTGVTLVVLAAGTQTTSIAKEYDAGGHATYYDSVGAARTHADGDALVLPVASVTKPDGTSTFVVGVSCRQATKFRQGTQYSVPCPPDSGVSSGRVASETTRHVEGSQGGETVRVHPRHSENAVLPPYWYVAHESVVSDLGRTGAFVVEPSGSGGASGAVSGTVPLRSALPFFLAGIRQVLTVLAITAAGTSVLVGVTVYGVTRMHTEDRRRAIRVIRATGGEARRIVRLYGLRAGAITAAGTALGYAVGVVTTNVVVNAAIYLGVPTSLAIRVTPRAVTILLPLYAATVAVGAIAGVVAAWKVTRDSPVPSASRRRSSNDGVNARLRGFLSRARPLSLLDWRVLLPSVVPLAAFATVVILVASITGVVTPLVHPGGSTVTDPGVSNPIASRVPAGYAAAIDRRGTEASPEILALDVHNGHPMVVRGVRFGSFANVSDATLVRGRRPHGPDEAVVGTDLARTLGLSTNDSVTLGGSTTPGLDRVKIVGEYAAPGPYDDQLLVSLPTARHLANVRPGNVQMVRTATRLEGTGTSASNGNASDGIAVVGVSAPAQVRQNASIPIRLQLQNIGSSQASRAVSVRVGDRNRTTTVSLDGGAQREVLVRLPAGRLGTERISVAGQRRTVRVVSGDAIEIRGLPDRAPPNTDPLVRVVDVSGNPVTNATVSGGNGRGGMKTGPNGTVRVHLGDSGPATIRATAGDRSATTTVRVSRSASRLPVGRLQVQPDRPTLLGRPTARLAVSNPWNETISRRVAVVSGSQRFTRNLTLGPGEQRTVTPQLDRRSPGSYAVTAAVDGRTIARTNYRVVGDDRVVSALANSGRSGGTGISRAITTAFGDLNLLIGVFVCLAGVMTVGSTTATVAYTVHSRRQVVGVHRATGASPLRILSLVLLDAITVGTVATILALVVAVVAVSLLAEAGLLVLYGVRITPLLTPRVARASSRAGSASCASARCSSRSRSSERRRIRSSRAIGRRRTRTRNSAVIRMSDRAGGRSRRATVLAALAVFLVGVGMRTLPLHWTPLPYNVDGFHFAALAHRAGRTGHLSAAAQFIHPDEFVFTAYLTAVSQATGVAPLHVAQLLVAVIGTIPALVVFVLVWRICEQLGWRRTHTRIAAVLGGLLLSLDGVYLGRSAAVSSEMLGHALVILTALAFYRALRTERPAWMALTLAFVVALPLTHNLSALVGALVLLAIFVRSLGVRTHVPTRRRAVFGSATVALFWLDMLVYYQQTNLTAAGYVTALPGLLVAWLVFLVLFAGWLPSAGTVVQRFLPTFAVGGVGTLLVANHFLPIFPGSASTAPLQLALLVPLALVGLVAAWGLPKLARDAGPSVVVVGLLVGPLVLIGFAMTGSLTHEYEALAVRGQVFAHFTLAALAAITAVDIGFRRGSRSSSIPTLGRRAVVPLVALCVVASAPFAFAGLHATPAQPTVTPTEFATGTFAANHVRGGWVGDGHMVIVTTNYYKDRTSAQYTPLYEWLKSGGGSTKGGTVAPDTPPPACPIVAQRSWTTLGAQVFPASPTKVGADRYDRLTANRSVVYSASGRDPLVVTTPRRAGNCPVGPNEGPAAGLSSPRNESGS